MRTLLLALTLITLWIPASFGQDEDTTMIDLKTVDYSKYDKIALSFTELYPSTADLAEALTKDIDEDYARYRVLFRWVSQNILYNPKGEQKAEKVFKTGSADAFGFVNLLAELCDEAGIWAEKVEGFGKRDPLTHINLTFAKANHSWLKVELEDSIYLSDPTWAAGKYNETKKIYIRHFFDTYFVCGPQEFVLSHLPEEKTDALMKPVPSQSKFGRTPIYFDGYLTQKIKTLEPALKGSITKSLVINFSAGVEIKSAQIIFVLGGAEPMDLEYELVDGVYEIHYDFAPVQKGEFRILLNKKEVFGFVKADPK